MPTDDVHMKQISFEQEWLHLLQHYVKPFNAKFFSGYYTEVRTYVLAASHHIIHVRTVNDMYF